MLRKFLTHFASTAFICRVKRKFCAMSKFCLTAVAKRNLLPPPLSILFSPSDICCWNFPIVRRSSRFLWRRSDGSLPYFLISSSRHEVLYNLSGVNEANSGDTAALLNFPQKLSTISALSEATNFVECDFCGQSGNLANDGHRAVDARVAATRTQPHSHPD